MKCSNCGKKIKGIGLMMPTLDVKSRQLCSKCMHKWAKVAADMNHELEYPKK